MPERLSGWGADGVRAAVVVLVYAGVGAGCGWLWFELWGPPTEGVVVPYEGRNLWVPEPYIEGYAVDFSSTGHYVAIGGVTGLVLGFVVGALTRRRELVVLTAALVGSALAGWLTYLVGTSLSPPDHMAAARAAAPGDVIDSGLVVRGRSPYLAWPVGTSLGLCAAFIAITHRRPGVEEPEARSRVPG